MSDSFLTHPSDQTLRSFARGQLSPIAAERLQGHLATCLTCRARARDVSTVVSTGVRPESADRPDSASLAGSSLDLQPGNQSSRGPERSVAPDMLPPGLADHPDYRILRELGSGGMGVVYLAHNQLLGRDEVLKVMGRHIIEKPGVMDRFLREMRAVARLRHANIVTAYSAFRLPDSIVFAMEYVEGHDLSKLVKTKGPLSVAHATNFIYQAALGLQHAHEEGMVHRDIKPGNLMLSRKGNCAIIKVLDFGLAKASREQPLDHGLTREGQMLGTPDYIAPEQTLDAQSADIRADIYSLGCTLYCLLKGGPPFTGSSLFEILLSHQSKEATPVDLLRTDVPAELTAVVAKMMAKQPEHRFQTPAEVARALVPFFKGGKTAPASAISSPPVSQPARPPVLPAGQTVIESPAGLPPAPSNLQAPAVPPMPAGSPQAPVNPGASGRSWRSAKWMWPAVAAGVFILAAVSTLEMGIFGQKVPETRVEPNRKNSLASTKSVPAAAKEESSEDMDFPPAEPAPVAQKSEPSNADTQPPGQSPWLGGDTNTNSKTVKPPPPPSPPARTPGTRVARKNVVPPPPPVAGAERVVPDPASLPPILGDQATPFDLLRHVRRLLHEMKFIKQPRKDTIRNQALLGLDAVLRKPNARDAIPHVIQIRKEIQALEELITNPTNLEKLQEATDMMDRAVAMARGKAAPSHRETSPRPASPPGNKPVP